MKTRKESAAMNEEMLKKQVRETIKLRQQVKKLVSSTVTIEFRRSREASTLWLPFQTLDLELSEASLAEYREQVSL